jgi:hypothetical protein
MSDRKIKIVRHLVDKKEIERLKSRSSYISFFQRYQNMIKRRNQFSDCPYRKDK